MADDGSYSPTRLLLPWLLLTLATVDTILVLIATIWLWDGFGTVGKLVAGGTVVFAFGALASLAIAFWTSILVPAVRASRGNP